MISADEPDHRWHIYMVVPFFSYSYTPPMPSRHLAEESSEELLLGCVAEIVHVLPRMALGSQQGQAPPQSGSQPCSQPLFVVERAVQIKDDGLYAV